MIDLPRLVENRISVIDGQIKEAKNVRDTAATPTESGSDKTRQIAEYLVDSLIGERDKLVALKNKIAGHSQFDSRATLNTIVTLKSSGSEVIYLLVLDGLGGFRVDNIFLLSVDSPLANAFLNQRTGYRFSFNNIDYEIISIRPNT